MKLGYFLPQMGKAANAENIKKVARRPRIRASTASG